MVAPQFTAFPTPIGLAATWDPAAVDRLPAVLTAYYAGPHQGSAIADAVFGVTNPGGKLPVTLPRHVGQVPIHHGQHTGSGYRRTAADIHHGYLSACSPTRGSPATSSWSPDRWR